jgi:Beta-propeller repeat
MTHARRTALLAVFALATVVLAAGAASAQGTELWAALYNGPGNSSDTGKAVVVDADGNVIVTGADKGSGTKFDWATLKYDSEGNLLWRARYVGPLDDLARDVAVDGNGDVYVAGTPFAVVKYSADGEQLWARTLGGIAFEGNILALDSEGNILVVGQHGYYQGAKGYDIAVAKLRASDGEVLWLRQWDGSNDQDTPAGLALGPDDSVYVAGISNLGSQVRRATLRYSSEGDLLWSVIGSHGADYPEGIAVDAEGNAFTAASTIVNGQRDYRLVKHSADGEEQWNRLYDAGDYPSGSTVGTEYVRGVVVDGSGNVTMTGMSFAATYPTTTGWDYATVQFDTNGELRWARRYNGPASRNDLGRTLAVDAAGSVYVTGGSANAAGVLDIATVKYDVDGNELWVNRYDGPAGGTDDVVETSPALAVTDERVYVTGFAKGIGTSFDYVTLALANT